MPDSCCALGCANNRKKTPEKSFYLIPKDPERREKWLSAIKRANIKKKNERWVPSSSSGYRLCSDHFIAGKKSDNPFSPDYIPSVFDHVKSPEKRRNAVRLEEFERRQKRKKRLSAVLGRDAHHPKQDSTTGLDSRAHPSMLPASDPLGVGPGTASDGRVPASSPHNTNTTELIPAEEPPMESENDPAPDHPATPQCPQCDKTNKQIQDLMSECQALRSENLLLKEKVDKKLLNEASLQNDDKKVNLLTGLPSFCVLMTIFQTITPCLKQKSPYHVFSSS